MHILAQAFSLPKAGNSIEEYEDAFWPEQQIDKSAKSFSFAVADGATETSFSGLWARMLVRAYCKGELAKAKMQKTLPSLQRKWLDLVSQNPLPWFAEEKLRSGAFSSLVGLTVYCPMADKRRLPQWQAVAIGDSCLFQVRDDNLIRAFPLSYSEQFNSRPALLSSNPACNRDLQQNTTTINGNLYEGDTFYLMTDALAHWFLEAVELKQKPWEILRDFGTSEEVSPFPDWIAKLRVHHKMRNDDVTLLRIEIESFSN